MKRRGLYESPETMQSAYDSKTTSGNSSAIAACICFDAFESTGSAAQLSSEPRHSATERSYTKGRPTRDAGEIPGSLVVRAATRRFGTTPVRMKPLPPGVTSTGTERQSRDLVESWNPTMRLSGRTTSGGDRLVRG